MPELPDLELYLAALRPRLIGRRLTGIRLASPFFLRSVRPAPGEVVGSIVVGLQRLGKRLVFALSPAVEPAPTDDGEPSFFVVLHLMIAGRLRWLAHGAPLPGRIGLAGFDFAAVEAGQEGGTLVVTEAGTKRRASLHLVAGSAALAAHNPGGREPLAMSCEEMAAVLAAERHTLKRALTDPHLFAGIGNAYSDEILHRAGLSPFALSDRLEVAEAGRLHAAIQEVLSSWRDRLLAESGTDFPTKVTAFRPGMAVHGRFGQPCPICQTPVQRIVYAENEANYCPTCQTGGRLLADRALSRLLRGDWPRTLAELEERRRAAGSSPAARRPPGPTAVKQ
jgi:formamidopyrimidine-DNA glycosylase